MNRWTCPAEIDSVAYSMTHMLRVDSTLRASGRSAARSDRRAGTYPNKGGVEAFCHCTCSLRVQVVWMLRACTMPASEVVISRGGCSRPPLPQRAAAQLITIVDSAEGRSTQQAGPDGATGDRQMGRPAG